MMLIAIATKENQELPDSEKVKLGQVWVCPICNGETKVGGEQKVLWSGKNLMCNECGSFSYYSEFTVKES